MTARPAFHDLREEILEGVWTLSEDGENATLAPLLRLAETTKIQEKIDELATDGLLELSGEQVNLTDAGERLARHVVRAHRLSARFLSDILEISPRQTERLACRLEHAISPELADSLCAFLGHPPLDPVARPIPRGDCCEQAENHIMPAVRRLVDLQPGTRGRISWIHARAPQQLQDLETLNLIPGAEIEVVSNSPSLVLTIGDSTLSLEPEWAQAVFVKPRTESLAVAAGA